METQNHKDAEVIAAWQGCADISLKDKAIVRARELVDQTNQWLRMTAIEMANKKIARNIKCEGYTLVIDRATLHQDKNMIVVVIDSGGAQVVGWAKFNPKDVKFISGVSKRGTYWFKEESKFRNTAGVMKALDRALDQLLP